MYITVPSLAYPSAQPQVSTLTNCNSMLRTGTLQSSTHNSPLNGSLNLHKVLESEPLTRN